MHEVEDAVAAWVETRDESGPGHRTLRRDGCAEPFEIALAAQAVEIGKRGPVALEETRVHAIDAEHDEFFGRRRDAAATAVDQDGCDQGDGYTDANTGLPSIHSGVAMPKRSSAVGARSSMPGSCASMARFENRTPGTSGGSIEWSPLHCFVLSSI